MRCGAILETKDTADGARKVCSNAECGWVFYDNPTPVVAAIVEHEGDVILARQRNWPEGWFGLITGFLERGETPEAGVLRELQEELGLKGEIVSLVGVYAFEQRNELIVAYHVRAEGEVKLGDELESIKRVPPGKLRPWPFGTGHAVRDWLARRAT
jgi:NADH pyrophosphatase NudC (nudix superfamily)